MVWNLTKLHGMKTLTPCIYHWRINGLISPLVVLSVLQLTGTYVRSCCKMDSAYLWCKNTQAPEAELPAPAEQEHRGLLNPWQSTFTNCAIQDNFRNLLLVPSCFSRILRRLQVIVSSPIDHPWDYGYQKHLHDEELLGHICQKKGRQRKAPKRGKWLSDTKWIPGLLIFICAKRTNFTILSP